MYNLKHIGVYVNDLENETRFYKNVFNMMTVCETNVEENLLLDDLFKKDNVKIYTTKLITEFGKKQKTGDMIELIKVISFHPDDTIDNDSIWTTGMMHIALGVSDIEDTIKLLIANGGKMMTQIHTMSNGNKCVFAKDPEGNWIEIIQNRRV